MAHTESNRDRCRFCDAPLEETFVDLGMSPPANSYVAPENLDRGETFFPLHTYVCGECFLVQLPEWKAPEEIFRDYAYFSSYSDSWLEHCRRYVDAMTERFALGPDDLVVEVASNDGYLLQYFASHDVPVLGVEPAENVAAAAVEKGVPTVVEFFGTEVAERLAKEGRRADLLLGNNVLAHTPHLNDFVAGLKILLADEGVITLELPHLQRLVESNQFDTIYHEHFSYFGFRTVRRVLAHHGLEVFDVDELPTHGGSLRIYARHQDAPGSVADGVADAVEDLAKREESLGYDTLAPYAGFGERVRATKRRLLRTLLDLHDEGQTVVGYGAPAKGVTFLNYCGIGPDLLPYTVDRSPHKQGHHLPGVHIPIHAPERIFDERPDVVWILPWNLKDEIEKQMSAVREWGGRFLVAIPEVELG